MSDSPSAETRLLATLRRISAEDVEQAGLGRATPPEDPTIEYEDRGQPPSASSNEVSGRQAEVTQKNLFTHRYAHPIVLDMLLLRRYGHDWLSWEPETVQLHLHQDFGGVSDLNMSKVMAVKTLHMVDAFWERWEVFCWCTMPFNEVFPDFEMMQVPTVAQCAVAVDMANRIRQDVPWSSELKAYLSTVHQHDHLFVSQPPLDFVEVEAAGLPFDKDEVLRRWPECRIHGRAPAPVTLENVQLGRMLEVYGHVLESQQRLRRQLPLVQHV